MPDEEPAIQDARHRARPPMRRTRDWADESRSRSCRARPRRRLLGGRESDPAGAARRAADRLRVHRRRARREGPELLELVGRAARRASPRASRRCAAASPAPARAVARPAGPRSGGGSAAAAASSRGGAGGGRRDRRPGGLCLREHAVCDHRRRQHRQGHDLARLDRHEDRESRRQRHPSRRNRDRHGRRRRKRRDQRRIDPRRRRRRRPRRAVRRLRQRHERRWA